MTNEIKVGDTVRVSKDAPRIYLRGWAQFFQIRESEVKKVEDDNAVIEIFELSLAIPTKYLVKVGGEEKEPRFKVGDFVRVNYLRMNSNEVYSIVDRRHSEQGWVYEINIHEWVNEMWLIPYTEPTEEKMDNTITIPVKAEIDDSFWDAYTADLAKEIAVKVACSAYTAEEVAEYAVKVAKSVVEELKKK